MVKTKITKKVMDLVEKFKRGEITEKNYLTETSKIPYWEVDQVWRLVVKQGASEEVNRLVARAKEVLEAMEENNLIDYSMIMCDFAQVYKDDPDADIGLLTHLTDEISYYASVWAAVEDEELFEALIELEENWLWPHVFPVVVAGYARENELATKAFESVDLTLS